MLIYITISLLTWPVASTMILRQRDWNNEVISDVVGATVLGLIAAILFPIAIPGTIVALIAKRLS